MLVENKGQQQTSALVRHNVHPGFGVCYAMFLQMGSLTTSILIETICNGGECKPAREKWHVYLVNVKIPNDSR